MLKKLTLKVSQILFISLLFLSINPMLIGATQIPYSFIRSTTYYPFPHRWTESDYYQNLANQLPSIKAKGFNCVWIIVPWYHFQTSITSPFNPTALTNLLNSVELLEQNDMCAIIPLVYLGPGWAPDGVDSEKWIFDQPSLNAYLEFINQLTKKLQNFSNIYYLVFNENTFFPLTLIDDPDLNQSLRNYLYAVNSSLAYWNTRLSKSFQSWNDVIISQLLWTDTYYQWMDYHARSKLSVVPGIIRPNSHINTKIGYHWQLKYNRNNLNELYSWNNNGPFDFLSGGIYPTPNISTDPDYWIGILNWLTTFLKSVEPQKPIILGEFGMSTFDWVDSVKLAQVANPFLASLKTRHMGFNLWMWRDFDTPTGNSQSEFGLIENDGTDKQMMNLVAPYIDIKVADFNLDHKTDVFDYSIFIKSFSAARCDNLADLNNDCRIDIADFNILLTKLFQ